ncbi:MAG: N-acetylglucosamine-6-sulfatase [Planctomycetes bacterium]|jgi:N-acetylglucosamine-6-sulfatase|nr:N-acetylglucosamine-6-sulfatase [Planctomycetota bacterium]MDP6519574.1 sulfatase [Planctomycetota bacterium]
MVVIYVDDLRADGLSATGNPWIETPHLDRLAAEGLVCNNAFVTTSLCCPGRVSVLTGKYAHATGVTDNQPKHDFQHRHLTFVDHLQERGYETAFVGKWHLPNPQASPQRGFDHWVSFEGQGDYFDPLLNIDGELVQTVGSNADVLGEAALDWIGGRPGADPFFLFLSFKNCHTPWDPPLRHRGLLDDVDIPLPASFDDDPDELPTHWRASRLSRRNRGAHPHPEYYAAAVRRYHELILGVDEAVGQLLAVLEQRGVLDDTLILFTSDNGYLLGEHGFIQKGHSYEPSIRVPLILRYPPKIQAGIENDGAALNVDIAPTLLKLAGLAVPDDVQGVDLAPLWQARRSKPPAGWREWFLYIAPWFQDNGAPRELALHSARWKYVRFLENPISEALFNLWDDPDERVNLAGPQATEQATAVLVGARQALQAEMERLGVPAAWFDGRAAASP